jgi:GNAT superfamily N-acetyltransferase
MTSVVLLEEKTISLTMGSTLHIRSLRPGEDSVVRDLFARLSLPTRYLRFFLPLPVLSDSLLRMIGGADDPARIAMVAETDDARRQVVALGNVAPAGFGRGEVGLVVADAWQRQGIGSALAASLLQAAQDRGYQKFVVYSLIGNRAVRPLLARVADVVSTRVHYGVSEIAFVQRRPVSSISRNLADDALERAYERMLARWRRR